MTLYIGAFYPDSELSNSIFSNAITQIASEIMKNKVEASGGNIDIQFLIPGKHDKPDFKGMRFSSFDEKTKTLKIQSSVPENMIHSKHAKNYVIAALKDATDNADDFFKEKCLPFDSKRYHGAINNF